MSRLAFCLRCDQMSKITDYKGNPDYDVVLQDFIDRHLHGYHPDETGPGKPHPGAMLFQVEERQSDIDRHVVSDRTGQQLRDESGDLVELSANEIEAVQVARKELRKIGHEIQDLRDELKFDAIVCHRQHGQPSLPGKPCRDYQSEAKLIGRKNTPKELRQWLCTHCFGGETMVVTRTGVFRFDELAEIGQAELLVLPLGNGRNASWKVVPVRSYGEQQLWDVTMWRGRQRRVVRATEGHRWASNGQVLRTDELTHGVRLDRAAATPLRLAGELPSAVGVMHGFVFGDGTKGSGNRPAYVTIYDNNKDKALHPYFAGCRSVPGPRGLNYVDLPKAWKKAPDLNESRSYLLGFLAGYFAADGNVTANGQAVLDSSVRQHVEMVRTICNLLGVQTSDVRSELRSGFGGPPTALYSTTIRTQDLPGEFWVIEAHAQRVGRTSDRNRHWVVESATPSSSVETVYCAEVGGSEKFVLDNNLVTYNCAYESSVTVQKRANRGDYALNPPRRRR